jgi:hypothetical protein
MLQLAELRRLRSDDAPRIRRAQVVETDEVADAEVQLLEVGMNDDIVGLCATTEVRIPLRPVGEYLHDA